jgi:uncharacterized membrane protein YcaP (DUF421 family)
MVMKLLYQLFGEGRDLSTIQMCDRAIVVYFIALLMLRISGRRAFGKKTAFDNAIAIILGAVLSRAVVGASEFVPTVACCMVLVLLHRILSWARIYSKPIKKMLEGQSITLYKNGKTEKENLTKSLICEEELMGDIRQKANLNSYDQVEEIVMETSGEVSIVKKQ